MIDKYKFMNTILDLCMEDSIPEEKRIIQIIATRKWLDEFTIVLMGKEETWIRSKYLSDKGEGFIWINGIRVECVEANNYLTPLVYIGNQYKFGEGKVQKKFSVQYNRELDVMIMINKFDWRE